MPSFNALPPAGRIDYPDTGKPVTTTAFDVNPILGIHAPTSVGRRSFAWPRLSGHKNIIRIFWVKLLVARFWSDFKESCAVCVIYFCKAVPFWECAEEIVSGVLEGSNLNPRFSEKRRVRHPQSRSVAGMRMKTAAEILQVLDLIPNPSNLEGLATGLSD
jgi:hypothetical protein